MITTVLHRLLITALLVFAISDVPHATAQAGAPPTREVAELTADCLAPTSGIATQAPGATAAILSVASPLRPGAELNFIVWPAASFSGQRPTLTADRPRLAGVPPVIVLEFVSDRADAPNWLLNQVLDCADRAYAVVTVQQTIAQANRAWAQAVLRPMEPSSLTRHFSGPWLEMIESDMAGLRDRGEFRSAELLAISFTATDILAPDAAIAETQERWADRTYSAAGVLVRDISGELRQRYDLRLIDGVWKVVNGRIEREQSVGRASSSQPAGESSGVPLPSRPTSLCPGAVICEFSEKSHTGSAYRYQQLYACMSEFHMSCAIQFWVVDRDTGVTLLRVAAHRYGVLAVEHRPESGDRAQIRVLLPSWSDDDPGCCPSQYRETTYSWDAPSMTLAPIAERLLDSTELDCGVSTWLISHGFVELFAAVATGIAGPSDMECGRPAN